MGFVHHTDNANGYAAGDVPGIIRSIYAFHVQSNHWCDIGYNFLVDRFGRIFEGRYGGTALPVIGAHTGAFNTDTFAASMIGNFSTVAPPTATLNAMADLYAWKLGSYYRNPTGKTVLVAGVFAGSRFPTGTRVTFNTVSGHRDADFTACPGDRAYALLPTLRAMIAARLPHSAVSSRYATLGGQAGVLGEPILQGERIVPGGLMTQFQGGSLTWSSATGARRLSAPFAATYLRVGGPTGFLGFPVSRDEATIADGHGRSARFQRGFIHSSPATGAHETHGAIADRYALLGFESGVLGYPQNDVTTRPDGVGRYSRFDRGYIFYTPALGAHEVYGVVLDRWRALGFEAGVLGYPTTDPAPTADTVGVYQHFQNGSVFWSPATGPHEVRGAIRDRYSAQSWERGALGYPTSDERTVALGVVQTDFQHGSISWNLMTGGTTVTPTPVPTPLP
ncbi:MAG TPA: N-acetylmuramoyl-L-alanine amidase [Frankiaceae bacterium]|nr:N-acetylmuramoyl-L-alanine amidase [Frankiaceae bacterium]